ncbi:hypothetical protein B0T20DRAFT_243379 [Sordaria brevicollis]|uniref:Fucose-specific lectin n=1 Tax=Sordaria brevicollis TaxID=83679 RepID=A0AAE0PBC7_SORBR|nr:hypothetical protein B0T20DRAFT_243379 [Sordaria brevicollis]
MANPVTTILSPKEDFVLLYYVDGDKRLALKYVPVDTNKPVLEYSPYGNPAGQNITNQSIAAVYLYGLPVVFGQLQVPVSGDVPAKRVLAQLSPVVQALVDPANPEDTLFDERYSAFAAINSRDQDMAWCYFLKSRSAGEGSPAKITLQEVKIVGSKTELIEYTDMPDDSQPDPVSRLAALYVDQTHREVYYQRKGGNSIYCYRIGSGSPPSVVPDTGHAMKGTPISVTRSKGGTTYLYYVDKDETEGKTKIGRVTRDNGESKWKPSAGIMSEDEVGTIPETQLAVTHVKCNDELHNVLTFIPKGGNKKRYEPKRDRGGIA